MQNSRRLDEALTSFRALLDTSNTTFLPLYSDMHRYLVLKGGAGSGKSNFAAHKILDRCVHEGGHRFLACRKVKETLRKSVFEQLISLAPLWYPNEKIKINLNDMTMKFPTGSVIYCVGLSDVARLKSIYEITDVWIEEAAEVSEQDFNQLDIRMRGQSAFYRQMILTFNPVSVTHWLKKRFFDKKDDRARTHESVYTDNRYLSDEDRLTLEKFRETDPYYYTVYCLGQWGSTEKTVFDAAKVLARMEKLPTPRRVGLFCDGKFTDAADGFIRIYEEPVEGRPYVIGADTAGEGSDRFAAHVIDNTTGRQVAVMAAQIEETAFVPQLFALGTMYNTALIAVECNFSTYTVRELERLGYKRQYVRESFDSYTGKTKKAFGFVTNKLTRPVILTDLIRIFCENPDLICDRETLEEFLTFVRNEKLRMEAALGAHDDLVMSLAIAYHAREQAPKAAKAERAVWSRSMWEDYDNASPAMRARMKEEWGEPVPRRKRK